MKQSTVQKNHLKKERKICGENMCDYRQDIIGQQTSSVPL